MENLTNIWLLTWPIILAWAIEIAKKYWIKAKNIILFISIILAIIYFFYENEIKELLPILSMIALFSTSIYEYLIKNLNEEKETKKLKIKKEKIL